MIGRRINGEQADHLARFMAADRARCAFEEADRAGRFDLMMVSIGIFGLIAVLALVQYLEIFCERA